MKTTQLSLIEYIRDREQEEKPYRNDLGELLPWEELEYLDRLTLSNDKLTYDSN